MRVMVTGANGFVGRAVCAGLAARGHAVTGMVRRAEARGSLPEGVSCVVGGDIAETPWEKFLRGKDAVVHLAGMVHVRPGGTNSLDAFRRVNVGATRRLGEACFARGIRLVFVSSVRAESPNPSDLYGQTKREAETSVSELAATGLEAVVIRPPGVYGPGVHADFVRLLRAVDWNLPLPVGRVRNARSFVFVGNLADALSASVERSPSRLGPFAVTDGVPVSIVELVETLARHLGRRPVILPVPVALLRAAGIVTRRPEVIERLVGDAIVDDGPFRKWFGWTPPMSWDEGIASTVAWYRTAHGG